MSRADTRREELTENIALLDACEIERKRFGTIVYRRPVEGLDVTLSVEHALDAIYITECGWEEDNTYVTLGGVELKGADFIEAFIYELQKAVASIRKHGDAVRAELDQGPHE